MVNLYIFFRDELIFGEKPTLSAASASASAATLSTSSNEQSDVDSALRQKRKSISRILKKYKKQPEIQQQLKIAFADGYSFAEQVTAFCKSGLCIRL